MAKLSLVRTNPPEPFDRENEAENSISSGFKAIYYQYHEQISRFIWLKVNSVEVTKDLTQEVFLRVWRTQEKIDPQKSVKAFIYAIANNLVIDYLRKKKLENMYLNELTLHKSDMVKDSIELNTSLKFAINNLPEKLKTVFLLGRYQGLHYSEIAEICQVSYKTVVVRMRKAMSLLKKELS